MQEQQNPLARHFAFTKNHLLHFTSLSHPNEHNLQVTTTRNLSYTRTKPKPHTPPSQIASTTDKNNYLCTVVPFPRLHTFSPHANLATSVCHVAIKVLYSNPLDPSATHFAWNMLNRACAFQLHCRKRQIWLPNICDSASRITERGREKCPIAAVI